MSRPRLIALLLACFTLVTYLPVGWYQFVNYDDPDYVLDNEHVRNGLNANDVSWAFTSTHAANWHPLTWISLQLDCSLFALNAGALHMVNALIHAANVALLFILILRMTDRLWPAAMIAALFAWHPLHVESVAWISERKDVLSTFFALLSLLSYTRFAREKRRSSFWWAGLFFVLGLLAKPMLVTLPFVMLLLDFWPFRRVAGDLTGGVRSPMVRSFWAAVVEKWPFFVLAILSCVVTVYAQGHGEAMVSLVRVPFHYRIQNVPISAVRYLGKLFWPTNLSIIYLLAQVFAWQAILSVLVLLGISLAAWRYWKTKPYLLIGWLWFLGTLVPVIGIIQVGSQSIADRYMYIPSIGFFLAVVLLAADWFRRWQTPPIIVAGISAIILVGCIRGMEMQLTYWRDSESLFRHAIAVEPDNVVAINNLAVVLDKEGNDREALAMFKRAEAVAAGPYYQLHNNIAEILGRLGYHREALVEYAMAIQQHPNDPLYYNALGSELVALGQYDEAYKAFARAEQLDPTYAWPHVEMAKAWLKQGKNKDAINELRAALKLDPNNYQILAYTAHILAAIEDPAVRDGRTALTLAIKANDIVGHTQPMVFDAMGMACATLGDFTNAAACAQNALNLGQQLQMGRLEPVRQRLELYEKHQPWRESFLATNAPAVEGR